MNDLEQIPIDKKLLGIAHWKAIILLKKTGMGKDLA